MLEHLEDTGIPKLLIPFTAYVCNLKYVLIMCLMFIIVCVNMFLIITIDKIIN